MREKEEKDARGHPEGLMKRWRKLKRGRKVPSVSSGVRMDVGQGTFITDTGGTTVAVVRSDSKETNTVIVKEDILYKSARC